MSIDTRASIVIGLPCEEVDPQLLDDGALDTFDPMYDGGEYALAGFSFLTTRCYEAEEITWDAVKIGELMRKFRELTGKEAKVWLTPNVS